MPRFQCRKLAAEMRARFFPGPTPEAEVEVMRVRANLNQDIEAEVKNVTEFKSDAAQEVEMAKSLVEKAKREGLVRKPEVEKDTSNEVKESKAPDNQGVVKSESKGGQKGRGFR